MQRLKHDIRPAVLDLDVLLDNFNAFDLDAVRYQSEVAGTASGGVDESFGEPIYCQTPRRVRLGFGLNF